MRAARAKGGNKGFLLAGAVAAFAAFLPFVRLFLGGQSLYFRDLASHFLPLRRFLLEGIAGGEWRFWNPFVHEGEPLLLSPFAYLPDLFQLLLPNESGISLFLALHLPFAAVSFVLLARELELGPIAAAAGGIIYALGGFSLSTVNLYIYTQTIAWAPLFILAFRRALDRRGGRAIVLAAGALAMMISTTGMEIALQACLLAVIIAPPLDRRRFGRASASAVLGLGLGGAVILPVLSLTGSSARGAGFPTSTVLTYSIHPVSLVQTFIAGLFGDTANLTGAWWGWNFFAQGFPYILSLYLGPVVLCLAALALTLDRPLGRRLALAACAFGFIGLGAHAGWAVFFDLSPSFRFLRYPVKAFFAVQFSIAMLASFALEAIASGGGGLVLRRLLRICFGFGLALAGAPLLPLLAPTLTGRLLDGLLPASLVPVQREVVARLVTADAAAGGVAAVAVALVAWLALRGRLPLRPATAAIVALIAADLIRAGAGLNAGVTRDFYRLSPEMAGEVSRMRDEAARVFTCDPEASPAYWEGRRLRGEHHEAFSGAVMQETLTPAFNVSYGVRTALSPDPTSLAPANRVLDLELAGCGRLDRIIGPLQGAGVTRVLSLDPLTHPSLRLLREVAPSRIEPLRIHIYDLADARPRFSQPVRVVRDLSNHLDLDVVADRPTRLEVLEPWAAGWSATVNGTEQPILRSADGHREIGLEAGPNRIRMAYQPPGLRKGLGLSLTSGAICLALLLSGWRRAGEKSDPDKRA